MHPPLRSIRTATIERRAVGRKRQLPAGAVQRSMRSAMRFASALAWLALTLLVACDKKPPPAAEIRPVRTVTATPQSDGEPVSLTGHIRARTEESLAFR